MEIEKEVRYVVTNEQIKKIKDNTVLFSDRKEMLDISCGYDGFDSYMNYGYICRIRKKGNDKLLEVKKYSNKNECVEQSIKLERVEDGVNYLKLIGMKPYLYLKRFREIRLYNNLKIFIDEFDMIGNFIEIEYQDSNDEKKELKEFMDLIGIDDIRQETYGDIVKNKIENDLEFKKRFNENLDKILSF